jgi:hypothetical protein
LTRNSASRPTSQTPETRPLGEGVTMELHEMERNNHLPPGAARMHRWPSPPHWHDAIRHGGKTRMKPNQRLLQLNYYCTGEGPPPASTPAHAGEEREGPSIPDLEQPEERGSGELGRGKEVPFISILF